MMQNMVQNAQAEETEQNPWVSKSGGDFLECTLSNLQSPLTPGYCQINFLIHSFKVKKLKQQFWKSSFFAINTLITTVFFGRVMCLCALSRFFFFFDSAPLSLIFGPPFARTSLNSVMCSHFFNAGINKHMFYLCIFTQGKAEWIHQWNGTP